MGSGRYGEKVATDCLMSAVQMLAHGLHEDYRLFQWSSDSLMAVLRRHTSYVAVRMEVSRLMMNTPQHLVEQGGQKTMLNIATSFDLLPLAQFSTIEELLGAFKAKLIGVT